MKKSVKITLWVVGAFVVLVIGAFLSADIIASRIVQKEVRKAFERMPEAEAQVGGIYLNLISGSAIVKDITFCTYSLSLEDTITGTRAPGLAVHIPTLAVWNIRYKELLREHALKIYKITVDDPQLLIYLDEKDPASLVPAFPKDTTLEKAGMWLEQIGVSHFEVNDFQARLHSVRSPLNVSLDSLSVECQDLQYSFLDSLFSYNDSVYELSFRAVKMQLPDGLFDIEVHDLNTKNQGPLALGYTRMHHIATPKQLADLAHEPASWIDLELNSLSTSAFNPIRKVLRQDYTLDAVNADVKRLHVIRDTRYAPKQPFGTPQDFLRSIPVHFALKQVNAKARKIDIELFTTETNCGQMHLKNGQGQLSNVTNKAGATWVCRAHAPFGPEGKVAAQYNFHLDKHATFDIEIHGTDLETSELNAFIRPLVGITSECHIDQLDAVYHGDREIATGTFCMQYHGLNVQVHKEDQIPYEIVTKHANTFTQLANTLVPKSNPTAVDPVPRQYDVSWTRDEWKPYPLYLFGPCIDGVKMTMLPGLYVHKQTKKSGENKD